MSHFALTRILPHQAQAANQARFACVRLHRHETDGNARLSLSGKLSEVCLALEQLAAREAQALRRA